MILHDRVMVITGGYRDAGGNVLPIVKNGPFPADMRPLRSSETIKGGALMTAYYRGDRVGREAVRGAGGRGTAPRERAPSPLRGDREARLEAAGARLACERAARYPKVPAARFVAPTGVLARVGP